MYDCVSVIPHDALLRPVESRLGVFEPTYMSCKSIASDCMIMVGVFLLYTCFHLVYYPHYSMLAHGCFWKKKQMVGNDI